LLEPANRWHVWFLSRRQSVVNPARRFYERLGMSQVGDWLRYGGDEAALRKLAQENR